MLKKNSFVSPTTVKWCPGCGDYAILKHLQQALDEKDLLPEQVAFVSGIGCSSRLPHYMRAYGFHTVHGRAPCVMTGLMRARPDLVSFLITGDGDGLSIGLGHLLHLIKRNVNTTVILLNNRIYGLTKGQNSPTTQQGFETKMTPDGHAQDALELGPLLLDMGGTFYGRCYDIQGDLFKKLINEAIDHQGTSVIEVYQSCPIFNKEAFDTKRKTLQREPHWVCVWPDKPLEHDNKSLVFKDSQWIYSDSPEPYQPSLIHAWSLLKEPSFESLGLIWKKQLSTASIPVKVAAKKQQPWEQVLDELVCYDGV